MKKRKVKSSVKIKLPDRKYQIIYADPPWNYNDQNCQGAASNHYQGMKIDDICSLPVYKIADVNCVLFLWATNPMLQEAFKVIDAWGFFYKSVAFQWIKLNPKSRTAFYGLGRWTRGNTEPCLIATKGKPKRISTDVFQLVQSPRLEHSRKPKEVRDKIIKLMGDLPRIELFARDHIQGWDVWGDEAPNEITEFQSKKYYFRPILF